MKILIEHLGTRGGGPQLQAEIARALIKHGESVFLAFDTTSEMSEELMALRAPTLRMGTLAARAPQPLRMFLRMLSQPLDAVRMVAFCKKMNIDIVFEPMSHPFQILPRRLVRALGIRVLTSVHDAERHAGEENSILSWLSKDDLRNTDGVVVYSSAVKDALDSLPVPIFQTVHGAFGVPVAESRTLRSGSTTVGFFGRIEKYKGIDRFVAAVEDLQSRGHDVIGKIVGRGQIDDVLMSRIRSADIEIENRWVDEREIPQIIADFDVLALPYDEASQSGVIGFALNASVPIVATPVGGLVEQLFGTGSVLTLDLNPSSFADAIETVISDDERYARLARTQLTAAQVTYSWGRVASDISRAAAEITVHAAARGN